MTDFNILVNKNHPLPKNYKLQNLVPVPDTYDFNHGVKIPTKIHSVVYDKFIELCELSGMNLVINSGYRSPIGQAIIGMELIAANGLEMRKKIAKPGTSEHHTGLAIDIYKIVDGKIEELTDEDAWELFRISVENNLGFIYRYPKEKEKITGIPNEPWHMRYIDPSVAKILYDHNIVLEEYHKNPENYGPISK